MYFYPFQKNNLQSQTPNQTQNENNKNQIQSSDLIRNPINQQSILERIENNRVFLELSQQMIFLQNSQLLLNKLQEFPQNVYINSDGLIDYKNEQNQIINQVFDKIQSNSDQNLEQIFQGDSNPSQISQELQFSEINYFKNLNFQTQNQINQKNQNQLLINQQLQQQKYLYSQDEKKIFNSSSQTKNTDLQKSLNNADFLLQIDNIQKIIQESQGYITHKMVGPLTMAERFRKLQRFRIKKKNKLKKINKYENKSKIANQRLRLLFKFSINGRFINQKQALEIFKNQVGIEKDFTEQNFQEVLFENKEKLKTIQFGKKRKRYLNVDVQSV